MPDVWTKHPEIVRDLLKEAGFTCGVEGRFLKGRDPAWTCIYDGKTMKGDLYIHHADQLRSELRSADDALAASVAPLSGEVMGASAAIVLVLALAAVAVQRARPAHAPRGSRPPAVPADLPPAGMSAAFASRARRLRSCLRRGGAGCAELWSPVERRTR